ncbi:DUF4280 domain-containing protein [Candidatus Bealeia paramacronuclearis]|uniref:DUF4280 domain-containing protein n=1 Tax=Candidatus Bealeia paramacronuclearis TaxID=1921001 RepID=A0ABZ2C028_9PROT|nr:hypothetical protein [Candidatus Bealeia paramacronuclearis]
MTMNVVGLTSLLDCCFGIVPTPLIVLPDQTVCAEIMLAGNIIDIIPFANIPGYVMCISLGNPQVLSATISAGGVLTPQECTPMTFEPWISMSFDVMIMGPPALDQTSMLICDFLGLITVAEPGNFTVMVP